MEGRLLTRKGWSAVVLALAVSVAVAQDEPIPRGVVRVVLQARARVNDSLVNVGDVAVLRGGTPELVQRLASLDLAEATSNQTTLSISRSQLVYRLLLAGIDPKVFRLEGAERVQVSMAPQELTEAGIWAAARSTLRRHLPMPLEEVALRLTQPIVVPRLLVQAGDKVRLEGALPPTSRPLGKAQVDVTVFVNGHPREVVPVALEVLVNQTVPVVKQRIEAGQIIQAGHLFFDRRDVDTSVSYATMQQIQAGLKARRPLVPGQAVTSADVDTNAKAAPALIKNMQVVTLVARAGTLRVMATGEAMQDGQVGQVIRVRNVASKNIVTGRVTERGIVEVE